MQTASKQKVKMDEQDIQHKHADHILLPVTAAMSHNGVERPAMHWSFGNGCWSTQRPELA